MKITHNFSMEEFTFSAAALRLGINNELPPSLMANAKRTCEGLEKIRQALGCVIDITSGFRCPNLNKAIGGAPRSQHMLAQAADIVAPKFGPPRQLAARLAESLEFFDIDQIILEYYSWVHVSFSSTPRRELLTIRDAKEGYISGIVL